MDMLEPGLRVERGDAMVWRRLILAARRGRRVVVVFIVIVASAALVGEVRRALVLMRLAILRCYD